MADDLVSRTTAIMMPQYEKDFVDCVAKKRVELYWAKKNDVFTYNMGGRSIEWRARLSQGTPFAFLGGMEGHTPAVQNDFQVASLNWKGLAAAFAATYAEKMQCKEPWQIIKLVSSLSDNLTEDWVQEWATQFYGDGTRLSSTAYDGLDLSMPTGAAGTYANISMVTYTDWANQAIDATGFAANPFNFLQQGKLAAAVGLHGGRDRNLLDIYLGTDTDFRVACQSEFAKVRYETDVDMLKAGFENISAWGVPFAWSETATANRIYGLNSKNFEFQCNGPQLIDAGTQETTGFPFKVTLGYAVGLHQMLNKNPRGSVVLYNTGS